MRLIALALRSATPSLFKVVNLFDYPSIALSVDLFGDKGTVGVHLGQGHNHGCDADPLDSDAISLTPGAVCAFFIASARPTPQWVRSRPASS